MSRECAQLGLFLLITSAIVALPSFAAAAPVGGDLASTQRAAATQRNSRLEIHVAEGGWGSARTKDIETVLYSVASVLLEHFPERRLDPIMVSHTGTRPKTFFKRGPNNEYRVQLSASDRYWARYAYEFAHELSHILSNYEYWAHAPRKTDNQWFDEVLCEVASLYALKRISVVWESFPPHAHWAAYAPTFARYAEHHLNESHRRLPRGLSLAAWFERNERDLTRTPYSRTHNELVANVLFPLFEENPRFWGAIGYLNLRAHGGKFRDYLYAWHANAPEQYKGVIRQITSLFGPERNDQASRGDGSRRAGRAVLLTPVQSETAPAGPVSPSAG